MQIVAKRPFLQGFFAVVAIGRTNITHCTVTDTFVVRVVLSFTPVTVTV